MIIDNCPVLSLRGAFENKRDSFSVRKKNELADQMTDWLTDQLVEDWLVYWLIDRSIDWWTDLWTDCPNEWLADELVD